MIELAEFCLAVLGASFLAGIIIGGFINAGLGD
jgi:hypothetical protein